MSQPTWEIRQGHVLDRLREMPAESVHCCVTSPPYWGLRDYGTEPKVWGGDPDCEHQWGEGLRVHKGGPHGDTSALTNGGRAVATAQAGTKDYVAGSFCQRCGAWSGQLGLEPTPDLYVAHLVETFREVRRVLAEDGTLWLNLGDSYATGAGQVGDHPGGGWQGARWTGQEGLRPRGPVTQPNRMPIDGLKPKDLVGIPWRVAFALQADGWWLRSDVIWEKPNPMPESVRDRPTKAHEYIFLLSKSRQYYYDADAIAEKAVQARSGNAKRKLADGSDSRLNTHIGRSVPWEGTTRNRRSVWTIATRPYPQAHFATFPLELPERCVLAGSRRGGVVLDAFAGAGTTGLVALRHGRSFVGLELNPEYVGLARARITSDAPLLNTPHERREPK